MMKGRISKHLEEVLSDPGARKQLRRMLISGQGGRVSVGNRSFNVSTDVRIPIVAHGKEVLGG